MTNMKTPEDVVAAFQAAWNDHDMAAFGRLFGQDATFVNRFGHYVRGVEQVVALHVPIHETIYRDSTLQNELIDIACVSEGVRVCRTLRKRPIHCRRKPACP